MASNEKKFTYYNSLNYIRWLVDYKVANKTAATNRHSSKKYKSKNIEETVQEWNKLNIYEQKSYGGLNVDIIKTVKKYLGAIDLNTILDESYDIAALRQYVKSLYNKKTGNDDNPYINDKESEEKQPTYTNILCDKMKLKKTTKHNVSNINIHKKTVNPRQPKYMNNVTIHHGDTILSDINNNIGGKHRDKSLTDNNNYGDNMNLFIQCRSCQLSFDLNDKENGNMFYFGCCGIIICIDCIDIVPKRGCPDCLYKNNKKEEEKETVKDTETFIKYIDIPTDNDDIAQKMKLQTIQQRFIYPQHPKYNTKDAKSNGNDSIYKGDIIEDIQSIIDEEISMSVAPPSPKNDNNDQHTISNHAVSTSQSIQEFIQ